jgi:hypothetical protein
LLHPPVILTGEAAGSSLATSENARRGTAAESARSWHETGKEGVLEHEQREPSIVEAIGRVVDAGQRVLVNRFDLVRLDVTEVATRTLHSAVVLVLGALVLGVAWVSFSAALVVWLRAYVTLAGSLALVGCGNAVAGGLLVVLGARRASGAGMERDPHGEVA